MNNFIKMPATPRGVFRFPALNTPDTKFGTDKGDPKKDCYKTSLVLPEDVAQPVIAKLEEMLEEGYEAMCRKENKKKLKRAPSVPWGPVIDKDDDDEEVEREGVLEIRFKKKARTSKGVEQRPTLLDASKNPLNVKADIIGGGSEGRIAYQVYYWYNSSLGFGMTLDIQGVQVLDLKAPGGSCASDFDEEDGFVAAGVSEEVSDQDDF